MKFMQELIADRKHSDSELPGILLLGKCLFHAIYRAFCTAIRDTEWNLKKLLCVIWYFLQDSPARHDEFQCISKSIVFSQQFCSTRWVEDKIVVERTIKIWPNVVKFMNKELKT